ncbi:hypothetical protein ABIA32_002210 [Streptacidiphilus sp. MAP12-20]|uniref:hypothetical protein n=1 Tax=Streptacidiphilus sp. MAP12-20 TaxID=3156299 RepID=UPI0035142DB0
MFKSGVGFYALFGYGWWLMGSSSWHLMSVTVPLGGLIALALMLAARRVLPASAGGPPPLEQRRAFGRINAIQWILIAAIATICGAFGVPTLIAPLVAVVVGAHFLPLATAFAEPRLRVPGALLIAVGLAGVLLWALGASHGTVFTTAGVGSAAVLWSTALWRLTAAA